ncbi:hypothetical protein AZE42_02839 [Rhizopogon vesiculosus]|uniref:Cytochrome P450 n=1 Tax=Rhizopogon vesiculosus TaxID=180088 RepID=A0A1J8Q5A0_9AGAM|nr:hypothetical protein AZE42_02839 [Rhizopogon vesiculosus]
MTQNEEKYPNPSQFLPERFLDDDGNLNEDTVGIAFGFGRRICVGRHVADASLWIAMSCMLARFTFSKAMDSNGDVINFEPRWSSGIAVFGGENRAHLVDFNIDLSFVGSSPPGDTAEFRMVEQPCRINMTETTVAATAILGKGCLPVRVCEYRKRHDLTLPPELSSISGTDFKL